MYVRTMKTDERARVSARKKLDELIDAHESLRDVSMAYVMYVLICFEGNKVHAGEQIGIDRRTIQRWLPETIQRRRR